MELEKTLESLLDSKEIKLVNPKGNQPEYSLEGLVLKLKLQYFATWCKELIHWKRLWCWEGLGAGGEGDHRGWDGWMASQTRWTWVWVNSGCWWWTGRPGMLRFMGLQRVVHDWATELNWTVCSSGCPYFLQFKSVFDNTEFMIWTTVSSQFRFAYSIEPLHVWLQRI